MLRKKRQQVAQEAQQKQVEEVIAQYGTSSQAVSKDGGSKRGDSREASLSPDARSPSASPSPTFNQSPYGDDEDDRMSEASSATTRSIHTVRELSHNEMVLEKQRQRLNKILDKSLKNVAARVQHTKAEP